MPGLPFTHATATEASRLAAAARVREANAVQAGLPQDPYLRRRLRETRADLVRARAMLRAAKDGAEFDRLASAIAKLTEVERTLAGRPLPGTLKPEPPKSERLSLSDALRAAKLAE